MNRPPPLARLEAVVSHAVPQVAVESMLPLPLTTAGSLQRLFRITLSDDRTLLLKLAPSLMLRLLRPEQYLTRSEPCVIAWMFREILEGSGAQTPGIPLQCFVAPGNQVGLAPLQATNMVSMVQEASSTISGDSLLSYLPAVIASSASRETLGAPFSLWEPTMGDSISSLPGPLTPLERRVVEYQKGYLVRQISQFRAPNSRFGPAIAVLGGTPSPSDGSMESKGGLPMPPSSVGSESVATWSTAFLALMENILRDGEDVALMINYSLIRGHLARLSYTLDDVTDSRLVLFDAASDANVLVTRSSKDEQLKDGSPKAGITKNAGRQTKSSLTSGSPCYSHREAGTTKDSFKCVGGASGMQGAADVAETNHISVTGLQDWSNCVFGDPLMVKAFSRNPSSDFLRGFRGQSPGLGDVQAATTRLPPTPMNTPGSSSRLRTSLSPCIIVPDDSTRAAGGLSGKGRSCDDGDEKVESCCNVDEQYSSAAIRLLLYECYHATVGVVKRFYRPSSPQSTQGETAARRRLTDVLIKLGQIQRGPVGGHNSSSRRPKSRRANDGDDGDGGGLPMKRAKPETGD
ncbi:hypothetical protein PG985_002679 [Apiospora marii]|uniref:uncharacterized protein n=1 Tax=Apiospora marii TaxID=335849 RepID=UPI00312E451A